MSVSNEDGKQTDNMEILKQQASDCAPGCACHSTGSTGRKRLIVGTIVLLVAVALVARAVIRTNATPSEPQTAAFALPTVSETPPAESAPATPATETTKAPVPLVAKEIGAFSELDTLAAANDAVFVYIPGNDGAPSNPPAAAMKSAASRIEAQGYKIGLFVLKAGTRDHDVIAAQMAVPGVVAGFKGRGMVPVSGDITETKLIQGLVAASSAGACGPSGCGPAGCD